MASDIEPVLAGNLRIVVDALMSNDFTEVRRGITKFRAIFLHIHYVTGISSMK